MLTQLQINFLNKTVEHWEEINNEIIAYSNVNMSYMNLTEIPVKFAKALYNFNCSNNQLTTLQACPYNIKGIFTCKYNNLTTLESGPYECQYYDCSHNKLTNLIGAPKYLKNFNCSDNLLSNLINGPIETDGYICSNNKLTSLDGCAIISDYLNCTYNKNLYYIYGINKCNNVLFDYNNFLNTLIHKICKYTKINNDLDVINFILNNDITLLQNAPYTIRKKFSEFILSDIDNNIFF